MPAWPQEPAWNRVSRAGLQAHTEFLASDLLEGRAPGSRGHELAAAYVAAQFRQFGLASLHGNDYAQPVPLLEAVAVLPGSSAVLRRGDEQIKFEYGSDFLPSADFFASSSTLSGPLSFVGFGINAPELRYDDFADIDLQGRIAVILPGAPARFNAVQRAYYGALPEKYANVIRRGAIGLIVAETPDADAPWEKRIAMSWMPEMRRIDDGQPVDAFPELKLRFSFSSEAAAKLFAEPARNFEQVLAAAAEGEPQGFELPGTLTLTATTGLRRTESDNVIGVLRGSDPKLKNEFVVLTAHLDHLGRGSAVNGDSIYNGAHDNAVGVAMLLETARALAAMNVRPKRSIVFAAVTAGDKGGLGADFLIHQGDLARESIVANIDLDTPLPLARSMDVAASGAEHSSLGSTAAEVTKALGFGFAFEERAEVLDEDSAVFMREGIPSLSLKSGNRARIRKDPLRNAKREFMENHYRLPSDEVGVAIDYAAAADLTAVNVRLAYAIADDAARPYWYRTSIFSRKAR